MRRKKRPCDFTTCRWNVIIALLRTYNMSRCNEKVIERGVEREGVGNESIIKTYILSLSIRGIIISMGTIKGRHFVGIWTQKAICPFGLSPNSNKEIISS